MRRVRTPAVKSGTRPILPGRVEPTWHEAQWPVEGETQKWNYPAKGFEGPNAAPRRTICPVCHAISDGKLWHLDEEEYRRLRHDPNVRVELCPADQRIQRQMYDGEVVLRGKWMQDHKEEVLNWVRNEEKRARATNPTARLAAVHDREDYIYILTTSQALARRIGSGLRSAFKGRLTVQRLPFETFTRVRWARD
ncbi:MAG: BCAM0308 family protein [Sphingomonadaceae bacterium]